ncbi:MAG: DUF1330 domain-containing protein [Deltaproteobacteria bacterium]|jgi:uncharacterized protein (DUF1330 family)|nr:DUF1330 domain-containing protein [Deltaproteobacteria bacterium]
MKVENQVHPGPENVKAFLAGEPEPIVMVNLLKFRDVARYADGRESGLTGKEAYTLYATEMKKLVEANGGRFIFGGDVESLLLGEVEELWDMVGLVEYSSPQALVEIASSPPFQEIEVHREAGLAGQLNIAVRGAEF